MDNNTTKRKVLIVDDEEGIRNLLRLTLVEEGFDVAVAFNGKEAAEKLKTESFDVLLTDIKMPIMDGIELLKMARELNPEIAAILITGFPSIDTVRDARRLLAFDYIVKPFDPNTVLNCINAALTRRTIAHDLEKSVQKPKILVVDDEPLITNLFEASLREEGYPVEIADNGKRAMERFLHGDFNVVITDVNMPEMDGRTLLNSLKSVRPEVIVIVITGDPSVDSAIETMRMGAYDYITKPIDPDIVINVIKRAWDKQSLEMQKKDLLKRLQDANLSLTDANEKLRTAQNTFKTLAFTDELTKLYNRRFFNEILQKEFAKAKRYQYPLSIIMLDIDRFKTFNDKYGHPTGDIVLETVAGVLKRTARESDIVARYGGEEFSILLINTKKNSSIELAERVRTAVEKTTVDTDYGNLRVTISLGIGLMENTAATVNLPEELFNQADAALLMAKQTGRNRVCSHTS